MIKAAGHGPRQVVSAANRYPRKAISSAIGAATITPNMTRAITIAGGGALPPPPPDAPSPPPTSRDHMPIRAIVATKNALAQPTAGQNRVRRIPSVPADSFAPLRANRTITPIRNTSASSRPSPSKMLGSLEPRASTMPSEIACPPTSPSTTAATATGGRQRATRRRRVARVCAVLSGAGAAEAAMRTGVPAR